jgi:enoyl-CoA hydratase/carnithine racemase
MLRGTQRRVAPVRRVNRRAARVVMVTQPPGIWGCHTMIGNFEHLAVALEDSVLRVTLNRPEISNALNDQLVDELRDLFGQLYWRHDIRIVVLDAAGKNFCAGLDMRERKGHAHPTVAGSMLAQRKISEIVIAMRRCPQPIVTLIQGAACGGGFALALASDVRLATPDLRMNSAAIRLGLSACDIGITYFLTRMVGPSVAAEFMLTGRFIDATRAHALGLVSAVGAVPELRAMADMLVQDMLNATPLGLRLTKEALNHAIDAPGLEAVIAMEDRNQILCAQGDDYLEGLAAFREKRRPNFGQSSK